MHSRLRINKDNKNKMVKMVYLKLCFFFFFNHNKKEEEYVIFSKRAPKFSKNYSVTKMVRFCFHPLPLVRGIILNLDL